MKIAIFALIAGLCLVAVAVNGSVVTPEEYDIDFFSQELAEGIEIEGQTNIFSGTYWVLKKVLRGIKGLNCMIKAVINIKNAAQQFPIDIHSCGVQVSKDMQNVLNSVAAVLSTCNDIINLNSNVCNNADMDDDSTNKVTSSCFWKMLSKLMSLRSQIKKTIALIKNVPTTGVNANVCVNTALSTLSGTFTQFPSFVTTCSQLVSS